LCPFFVRHVGYFRSPARPSCSEKVDREKRITNITWHNSRKGDIFFAKNPKSLIYQAFIGWHEVTLRWHFGCFFEKHFTSFLMTLWRSMREEVTIEWLLK
jgi:hypothetical protein